MCPYREQFEVDHIVALSLAYQRGDERARKRAYMLDNLQWLCHDCHSSKTKDDLRRVANLKAGRDEDQDTDPPPVLPLFEAAGVAA